MTGDRWQRVKALFQAAIERPKAERDAFLAAAGTIWLVKLAWREDSLRTPSTILLGLLGL